MVIEKTETTHKSRNRKLNAFDAGLMVVGLLCVCGSLLARAGAAGVNNAIAEHGSVCIDVMFTGVKTLDVKMFKVGDKSAITIRNQPVNPPMTVTRVLHWPKQVTFLTPDGKKATTMTDLSNPVAHDFLVTVQEDDADRTKDGWVIHGNKVKIGNPIELESEKYRVPGVIADIHRPDDSANTASVKDLETVMSGLNKTAK